ncbi:hypothetical protein Hanom_Chr00s000691g01655071 [Helianthus anomalus]
MSLYIDLTRAVEHALRIGKELVKQNISQSQHTTLQIWSNLILECVFYKFSFYL